MQDAYSSSGQVRKKWVEKNLHVVDKYGPSSQENNEDYESKMEYFAWICASHAKIPHVVEFYKCTCLFFFLPRPSFEPRDWIIFSKLFLLARILDGRF